MRSKSAALAAAVFIAGTGLIATAGTASAATAGPRNTAATAATTEGAHKAAYNGACGSGYSVVNSAGIAGLGTVYLTYNSSTGKNCVVTIRNEKGDPVHMSAAVRVLKDDEETQPVVEEGEFTEYAGPVYVDEGSGHCIEWSGVIGDEEYFNSGSNCGTLK
ncbi:spore-associated protein A [Streptomyces marispadix]|uniref:Spore-associated protein A n=1 Tax=Streptomyces marispadix TaxID=2922868 RepID=A0ABS9T0G6_9ACTN|nr:spore-associated protein A [Streptomyces marispadix]MCH6161953.1 spore-associated protein A [Streptomyces marispadix]